MAFRTKRSASCKTLFTLYSINQTIQKTADTESEYEYYEYYNIWHNCLIITKITQNKNCLNPVRYISAEIYLTGQGINPLDSFFVSEKL